jgi:hypothetical protein
LLEHRIGSPIDEDVAGKQQQWKAVGMRGGGGSHHVRRARPNGGGGDHEAPTALRARIGDRSHRHRLLVLSAPRRQDVLNGL